MNLVSIIVIRRDLSVNIPAVCRYEDRAPLRDDRRDTGPPSGPRDRHDIHDRRDTGTGQVRHEPSRLTDHSRMGGLPRESPTNRRNTDQRGDWKTDRGLPSGRDPHRDRYQDSGLGKG